MGQEVNAIHETERNWGTVQVWLTKLLDKAQLKDVTTEEMLVFPGMEELFSLLKIKEHAESGQYDVLVVDCAPTGETLRLLSYPNVLNWWLENLPDRTQTDQDRAAGCQNCKGYRSSFG